MSSTESRQAQPDRRALHEIERELDRKTAKRFLVAAKCCVCGETFTPSEPLSKGDEADAFLGSIFDHGCPDGLWLFSETETEAAA